MRLKLIKLAGFKSFVEPTKIPFPAAVTAIVGPNGCGKSNVIDAVRWVLGESTARQLRGGAMTDVIFNGSTRRAPNSKAVVELVFDNSLGRIQGAFAKYQEIAVRREVNRDGKNQYFINQTRCRRRDVVDLFSGTGLGPRSYSIIEQGMISRLIESRPEELRVFLEEAAGISRYKERRKETESRISHTRENLERLGDLRLQLGERLQKLRQQAEAAQQYRDLKSRQRTLQGELLGLEYCQAEVKASRAKSEVDKLSLAQEQQQAGLTRFERDKQQLLARRGELAEQQSYLQQQFYLTGQELTRLEQQRKHQQAMAKEREEQQQRLSQRQRELEQELAQQAEQLAVQQRLSQQLESDLEQQNQALECSKSGAQAKEQQLQQARESFYRSESALQQLHHQRQQWQQQTQALQALLDKSLQRQPQLKEEQSRLKKQLTEDARQTEEPLLLAKQRLSQQQGKLEAAHQQLMAGQPQIASDEQKLSELQSREVALRSRKEALAPLVEGPKSELFEELARQGITASSLSDSLNMEPEWLPALQKVMGQWLSAACVDSVAEHPGRYLLADTQPPREGSLAQKLSAEVIPGFLNQIYCVDSRDEAQHKLGLLGAGESVITAEGHWFGQNWADLSEPDSGDSALLWFEELRELEANLAENAEQQTQQRKQLEDGYQALRLSEEEHQTLESELGRIQGEVREAELSWREIQGRRQHTQDRLEALTHELDQLALETQNERQQLAESAQKGEQFDDERLKAQQALEQAEAKLNLARSDHQQQLKQVSELQQQREQQQLALSEARGAEQRLNSLQERYSQDRAELIASMEALSQRAESSEPLVSEVRLKELFDLQLEQEQEQQKLATEVKGLDEKVSTLSEQQKRVQKELNQGQQQLIDKQLQAQKLLTQLELLEQQLREQQFELDDEARQALEKRSIGGLQKELKQIATQLELLGRLTSVPWRSMRQSASAGTIWSSRCRICSRRWRLLRARFVASIGKPGHASGKPMRRSMPICRGFSPRSLVEEKPGSNSLLTICCSRGCRSWLSLQARRTPVSPCFREERRL